MFPPIVIPSLVLLLAGTTAQIVYKAEDGSTRTPFLVFIVLEFGFELDPEGCLRTFEFGVAATSFYLVFYSVDSKELHCC